MLESETLANMALPALNSLDDCVSFSKTVSPYLPQLLELPYQILDTVRTNPSGLPVLYASTNPLVSGLFLALSLGVVFIVAGEINRNYSQVDRFWSILPTVFIGNFALFAHVAGLPSTARLDLATAVSALWSTRLTYNYWRKGGYSIGSEDYRWVIIQRTIGMPAFHVLNWTFIGPYQCILLYAVSTPAYLLLLYTKLKGTGLEVVDYLVASMMLFCVLLSFIADQQQWNYQTAKYAYKDSKKLPANSVYSAADLDRGFCTRGMWAYSRHPNFAAEQSVWLTFFWWGANLTAESGFYNWTGAGALAYLSLFQGSTWLTEAITAGKYPAYKTYQTQVGMFLPIGGQAYAPALTESITKKLK